MNSQSANNHNFSFAVFDFIAINLIYFFLIGEINRVSLLDPYLILGIVMNISWVICSYLFRLYIGQQTSNTRFFKRTIQTFFLFIAFIISFIFFYHYDYSRLFILLTFVIFLFILLISRTILIGIDYFKKQYTIEKKVIVIGCNENSKRLIEHLKNFKQTIKVEGCFKGKEEVNISIDLPLLGTINDAMNYAVKHNIAEVYSTISPETEPMLYQLAEEAEKNFIRFKFVPDFGIFVRHRMHVELERDILYLSMRSDPLEDKDEKFKKRVLDIAFSIMVMILILWWLIPFVALLIKLESRGPVFFKQLRSGKNNKSFICYKFRTLKINADSDKKQVTKNDNRFTWIGKILRKTNIDELPQFLNVLQNTMSVVGPRPHMLQHTKDFGEMSQYYMSRHYLKPGITGWAQINGYRGEIKNKDLLLKRLEYDIWYMENWSMWLDLRIILFTCFKIILWDKNAV